MTTSTTNETSYTNLLLHSKVEKTISRLYNVKKYAIFAHLKATTCNKHDIANQILKK